MIDNFLLMTKIHLHIEVIVVYPELFVRLNECGLVVAQDQDVVTYFEGSLPLGDEVALAPLHEDGEGVIGDAHILQQVAPLNHRRADGHLRERAGEVFWQIHVPEDRRPHLFVDQPEPLRYDRYTSTLQCQRDEGDEEDDVEDHTSLGQSLYKEIKPVMVRGTLLATVGVLLTMLVTGTFIYFLFRQPWMPGEVQSLSFPMALLCAAVMSSTDSASVFSILRSKEMHLKHNVKPLLEFESGSNDPMAYMLTLIPIYRLRGSHFLPASPSLSR